jgi:hypothetical protein
MCQKRPACDQTSDEALIAGQLTVQAAYYNDYNDYE